MTSYVVAAEMKSGKVKANDPVMMSEHAWREGGAGTEGSYSGFEVNKTAPLVEMEKGMVDAVGQRRGDRARRTRRRQRRRVRLADERLRAAHRHEALALRQSARPVGAGALLDRARPGDPRPRADPRFPRGVLVQQDQGIHGRPDHAAQPQPACCGATRRSTASRPATTAARVTA